MRKKAKKAEKARKSKKSKKIISKLIKNAFFENQTLVKGFVCDTLLLPRALQHRDLGALPLVGPNRENLVLDPLAVQHLDKMKKLVVLNVYLKKLSCLVVGETSHLGVVLRERDGSDSLNKALPLTPKSLRK